MSRIQVCRKFHVDLWGELITTRKKFFGRLLPSIYQYYEKRPGGFLLRIDKLRPKKVRKPLSKFSLSKVDKDKLAAFYDFSTRKLRVVIKRAKHLRGNVFQNLLHFLEGQLSVLLYRAQICLTVPHAKILIPTFSNIFVNGNVIKEPKPGFHLVPYDFLTLPEIRPHDTALQYRLDLNTCRLREHHLEINYGIMGLVMLPIEHSLLFYYFSFEYANVFFTPRYH